MKAMVVGVLGLGGAVIGGAAAWGGWAFWPALAQAVAGTVLWASITALLLTTCRRSSGRFRQRG